MGKANSPENKKISVDLMTSLWYTLIGTLMSVLPKCGIAPSGLEAFFDGPRTKTYRSSFSETCIMEESKNSW